MEHVKEKQKNHSSLDKNFLKLIDYLVVHKTIKNTSAFCKKARIPNSAISNIRGGKPVPYSVLKNTIYTFNLNANHLFYGEECIFRGSKVPLAFNDESKNENDQLKSRIAELEIQLAAKSEKLLNTQEKLIAALERE